MKRLYSLAHLTAPSATPVEAIQIAATLGYRFVGLRLLPNGPGSPYQTLIGNAQALRETKAATADTGVRVFDLEIIRIGEVFDASTYQPLFETGAQIGAKAVLVVGDDTVEQRLVESYAQLCEAMLPYQLSANIEFMPWTAVPNVRAALSVITAAGTPSNAGVLVDALHAARSDTTLADIAAIPRALLHYAQMCDASIKSPHGGPFTTEELLHTARNARLQPGEGAIDLPGLFAALPADLPVSIEVVHLERMQHMSAQLWAQQCLTASVKVLE
jgi:sugar phosphate isomerase/epimerase